jgi:ribose transport system permease protein
MSQQSPTTPQPDYRSAAPTSGRMLPPSLSRALASILGPLIGLVVVVTIFGFLRPARFLTQETLFNVLSNNHHFVVAAVGMTFVVVTAGIDLSVGSVMALSCVCCALAIQGIQFPPRDPGTAIGIAAAIALFVGLCVAGRRLQAGRPAREVVTAALIIGGTSGLAIGILWIVLAGHALPAMPVVLAVLFGIAVGTLAGFINGTLITTLGLPPFIVTLATLVIYRGLTLDMVDGIPVSPDQSWSETAKASIDLLRILQFGRFLGFPPNVWIALLVVMIGAPLLHFTVLGRYAYAIGSNERTARLCGVNVERYKTFCYMIGGATAGLAGVMMAAKFKGGQPSEFSGAELTVIAAVVIGGTSLFGGEGTVIGSVMGVIMLGLLYSGCVIADIKTFKQFEFIGGTILLAAALDRFRHLRG